MQPNIYFVTVDLRNGNSTISKFHFASFDEAFEFAMKEKSLDPRALVNVFQTVHISDLN